MFLGMYECGLDEKSRVSIPAKFRDTLSSAYDLRLILANHPFYIVAYPYKEWFDQQEKIAVREDIDMEEASILRYIRSTATECPIDKMGRVLIPQLMRADVNIKKNVMIVGNHRKIEIWAREKWEEERQRVVGDRSRMQQVANKFGLS